MFIWHISKRKNYRCYVLTVYCVTRLQNCANIDLNENYYFLFDWIHNIDLKIFILLSLSPSYFFVSLWTRWWQIQMPLFVSVVCVLFCFLLVIMTTLKSELVLILKNVTIFSLFFIRHSSLSLLSLPIFPPSVFLDFSFYNDSIFWYINMWQSW